MALNVRALHVVLACTGLLGLVLMLLLAGFTTSENYTSAFLVTGTAVVLYWRVLGGNLPVSSHPLAGHEKRFMRGHQLIRWTNLVYYPVSVLPEVLAALLADENLLAFHMLAFLLFPAVLACWLIGLRAIWRSADPRQD